MNKKALTSLLATGIMAVAFSAPSQAAPILNGGFSIGNTGGGSVTTQFIPAPTSLTFNPALPTNNLVTATGGSLSGDFTTILASSQFGKILDSVGNTFSALNYVNIVAGGTTIVFDLTTETLTGTGPIVFGIGSGVFHVTGYADTPGYISFTTQSAGDNQNTWSASLTTTEPKKVPEPETLALFGIGLAALVATSRKAAKK